MCEVLEPVNSSLPALVQQLSPVNNLMLIMQGLAGSMTTGPPSPSMLSKPTWLWKGQANRLQPH